MKKITDKERLDWIGSQRWVHTGKDGNRRYAESCKFHGISYGFTTREAIDGLIRAEREKR